jgi:hypothetical protein
MSALLCCGSCFDTHNLAEDGNIYFWLDLLLTSSDDKVSPNDFELQLATKQFAEAEN